MGHLRKVYVHSDPFCIQQAPMQASQKHQESFCNLRIVPFPKCPSQHKKQTLEELYYRAI